MPKTLSAPAKADTQEQDAKLANRLDDVLSLADTFGLQHRDVDLARELAVDAEKIIESAIAAIGRLDDLGRPVEGTPLAEWQDGLKSDLSKLAKEFEGIEFVLDCRPHRDGVMSWAGEDAMYDASVDAIYTIARSLKQRRIELGRLHFASPATITAESKRLSCEDVRKRLEGMRCNGEAWPGQRGAAESLGCSPATIGKAIGQSAALRTWASTASPTAMAAESLTGMVIDKTAQSREADPADGLLREDVDVIMAKLVDDAKPEERAKLNALDDDGRRRMASLCQSQSRDRGKCYKRA